MGTSGGSPARGILSCWWNSWNECSGNSNLKYVCHIIKQTTLLWWDPLSIINWAINTVLFRSVYSILFTPLCNDCVAKSRYIFSKFVVHYRKRCVGCKFIIQGFIPIFRPSNLRVDITYIQPAISFSPNSYVMLEMQNFKSFINQTFTSCFVWM